MKLVNPILNPINFFSILDQVYYFELLQATLFVINLNRYESAFDYNISNLSPFALSLSIRVVFLKAAPGGKDPPVDGREDVSSSRVTAD